MLLNDHFKKIEEVLSSDKLELGEEIKKLLNTELCLGMTRFTCRHGTLGEGFEKFTDSQKYYQALRECYSRSNELKRLKAESKIAQAKYIRSAKTLQSVRLIEDNEAELLEATGEFELAELHLFELLVRSQDSARQLDEFNKVRLELQDRVRAQYPGGIEQAEPDNWDVVARYRIIHKKDVAAVPLRDDQKAMIAQQFLEQQGGVNG